MNAYGSPPLVSSSSPTLSLVVFLPFELLPFQASRFHSLVPLVISCVLDNPYFAAHFSFYLVSRALLIALFPEAARPALGCATVPPSPSPFGCCVASFVWQVVFSQSVFSPACSVVVVVVVVV